MKRRHIMVDLNAHISNARCTIEINDGNPVAQISFHNLSFGTITAIKFKAKGYNCFGDNIIIDGRETFTIVLHDLNIAEKTICEKGNISLPSPEIRTLVIQESQICFSSGEILTYENPDYYENDIEVFDPNEKKEQEMLEALWDYEKSAICSSKDLGDHWLCVCGYINKYNEEKCIKCLNKKKEVLSNFTDKKIACLVEQKQVAKLQAIKKRRNKIIKGICLAVITCFLAGMVIDASIISQRTTFDSESEMIAYLNGEWTYRTSDHSGTYSFSDTEVCYEFICEDWDGFKHDYTDKVVYNYKRGNVKVGNSKLILKGSTLCEDDIVYKKGTSKYQKPLETEETETENKIHKIEPDLELSNIALYSNYSYKDCTGTITNNGSCTYTYIKVKCRFKNHFDEVVDTDWTYAVGSEGLAPGEAKTFSMSVPDNSAIKSCSVFILDYK